MIKVLIFICSSSLELLSQALPNTYWASLLTLLGFPVRFLRLSTLLTFKAFMNLVVVMPHDFDRSV